MIMVSICVDNVVMLETFIDNLANICSVNVYSYFEFDHSHCHRDDDAAARTPEILPPGCPDHGNGPQSHGMLQEFIKFHFQLAMEVGSCLGHFGSI